MIIRRTEMKYRMPLRDYPRFRAAIDPFVTVDGHVEEDRRTYKVQSIYFDTDEYLFYREKIDGEDVRRKLRIRWYDYPAKPTSPAWIELKAKKGPYIKKLRVHTTVDQALRELHDGEAEETATTAIFFETSLRDFSPVVRIQYDREPLMGVYEQNTRITFDSNIEGSFEDVFNPAPPSRTVMLLNPLEILVEVKVVDQIPVWLARAIAAFNLQQIVYSKYVQGIENCGVLLRNRGIVHV